MVTKAMTRRRTVPIAQTLPLPVAATIEAYSKSAEISGRETASACGLAIGPLGTHGAPIRVTTDGKTAEYVIDRWD